MVKSGDFIIFIAATILSNSYNFRQKIEQVLLIGKENWSSRPKYQDDEEWVHVNKYDSLFSVISESPRIKKISPKLRRLSLSFEEGFMDKFGSLLW